MTPAAWVVLDAGRLEADVAHPRAAAGRDQDEVGLDARGRCRPCPRSAASRALAGVLDPRRPRAEVDGDLALLERPLELLARVLVLHRDQVVEHLDDRDLGPEVGEDRRELDADHAAAEDGQPLRHLARSRAGRWSRRSAGRRCRRPAGAADCDPVAMIADWNLTSSPPSTAIVFASVNAPLPDTIAISFALTTPVIPFTSPSTIPCLLACAWAKSSSRRGDLDAELGEVAVRVLERVRGLHPAPSWGCSPR